MSLVLGGLVSLPYKSVGAETNSLVVGAVGGIVRWMCLSVAEIGCLSFLVCLA